MVQYRIGQYALIRLDEGECGGRVGVEGGTTYQGHEGGENEGAQHCRCRARVCGVVVVAWSCLLASSRLRLREAEGVRS